MADKIHSLIYLECSAKAMENVNLVFEEAIRALKSKTMNINEESEEPKEPESKSHGCCIV